jgi:uncharacterized protein
VLVRALLIAVVAGGLLVAGAAAALARDQSPSAFPRGTATITTPTGKITLTVEIARTDEHRQLGLMNRRSLGAKAGMVFQYDSPSEGGFWMKNTLIPLDIAFYNVRGRIVRILKMEPCKRDPCKIYSPGAAYRGALEVNAGSFARWNVKRGDLITVRVTPKG